MGFGKIHHWLRVTFVFLFSLLLLQTSLIIAQLMYAGNAVYGKLIVYRRIRTEVNILLSI
jgi:hypothetical protein